MLDEKTWLLDKIDIEGERCPDNKAKSLEETVDTIMCAPDFNHDEKRERIRK